MGNEDFRDRFFSYETDNVGQGNVGMRAVTIEAIALTPFEEQKVIIDELERSFSMADRICTQVNEDLKRADRLRQSILKKAFSGKLLPSADEYEKEISHELPMAAEAVASYGTES